MLLQRIFFITFFTSLSYLAEAQFYNSIIYKDKEGMPSNRIGAIAESSENILWFVTQEGVCFFNGLNWTTIPDSLQVIPHLGQTKITTKADGIIYLIGSTPTGYSLVKFEKNNWSQIPLPSDGNKGTWKGYFKFLENHSDTSSIQIYNNQHLYIYSVGKWTKSPLLSDTDGTVFKAYPMGDSLWVGGQNGLYLKYNGTITKTNITEPIYDIISDPVGNIYVLGVNWVGRLTKDLRIERLAYDLHMGLFANGAITNMLFDRDRLYFSFNSPLYELNLKTLRLSPVLTYGFASDHTCTDALVDHEGNLWITTLRGAYMINNVNAISYNDRTLLENEVSSIFEDTNGDLYLGTNTGLSIMHSNGIVEKLSFSKEYLQPRVMDIISYKNEILLAANSAGIIRIQNHKLEYVTDLTQKNFTDLEVSGDELYASSNNQLLHRIGSKWELVIDLEKTEFHSSTIRKILFDDKHRFLLTSNGVYDLTNKTYIKSANANENNIYCGIIYKGEVLLGTAAGIRQVLNTKITASQIITEDFDGPIYALLKDQNDYGLWIGTERGVFLSGFGESKHLWSENGLAGNEINRNAFVFLKNGDLAVGTDKGLTRFIPNRKALDIPKPKVSITSVQLNNKEQRGEINTTMPTNELVFQFQTISYFLPEQINYRVRLIGFEQDWVNLPYEHQTAVSYKNLPPAQYQFEVQSRIAQGPWSDIAQSQSIILHAIFYQTLLFKIAVGLFVAAFLFAFTKWRNRQLKGQNDRLEKMVQSKTQELYLRNGELLKTIKDLKAAQGQLIQSEKLTSMGHLTAGIAHEMNNPLNYIRGGAECILKNLEEINGLVESLDGRSALEGTDYQMLMDESKSLAESILSGAAKSTEIVRSLRSFSSDGQHYFSFTDLEKEVENALTLLSNQIGFRITINRLFANVPQIECYPAKINQLIVNVLLNAIQSIEESGEISIRIFRKDTNYVSLEITDSGTGIGSEHLEMVFEPFFTTKDANSGLGLTMVRSIVQEHKGKIKLKSTVGKGTKLLIQFPVSQDTNQSS